MDPHDTIDAAPSPGLAEFAEVMRSVLRTRHDSPGDGPEALETWTRADGCVWSWTAGGRWRVTAGGAVDPRPLLHGPGGIWRVDAEPGAQGADLVLLMLRAASALPPPTAARRVAAREMYAVVGGRRFPATPPPEPKRAVLLRASDPAPELPAEHVAVWATSDAPDDEGRWEVTLPDGSGQRTTYDPARRCLVPYATEDGGTALLLFEPDQLPGHAYPARRRVRTALGTRDGGMLTWPADLTAAEAAAVGELATIAATPPAADAPADCSTAA